MEGDLVQVQVLQGQVFRCVCSHSAGIGYDVVLLVDMGPGSQVCPACCLRVCSQEHVWVGSEDELAQVLDVAAGLATVVVATVSGHPGVVP